MNGHHGPDDYFRRNFGVTDEDCRALLGRALARGGQWAELYFQHTLSNLIVSEDGRVDRAFTGVNLGLGVRVVKDERVGYAFCQALDMAAMLRAAESAAALADGGQAMAHGARGLEIPASRLTPGLGLYPMTRPWHEAAHQERMDLLRRVEEGMRGADPRIVKTMAQLKDSTSWVMIVCSDGKKRADMRPRAGLRASCVAQQGRERQSNYHDISARAGLELFSAQNLAQIAERAVTDTLRLFEARPLAAGQMPVVLAAGSAGILLHEAIGHGLEADFNRRGVSLYAGRLGQTVAGPQVTVIDDGTIDHAHGAINFDDEGSDSQRTVLVENGVLRSYLHDNMSAAWFNTRTTGSCRRQSYEFAPMPRMRATFMAPGPHKPEELVAAVDKGLYAVQFTNGQVDIGAGSFSFYVKSGWAIEKGRLAYPVRDVNIIGNGPEVLGRITMVADDLELARGGFVCGKLGQSVPVSQGMPTTLVSSINVGGTSEC
ncbi:peptidase U62 modulator of DNA gyrase [Desulfarculus baarsii DSM 2075]|uniref:Peptidase U62 modulator of DNA gyrase n=1 Tax=Desulfarculus baarsii (strain ATCC 33931 / DSM 2075 / LMG 7858 / VKM B-1802 / 2st14) TaxID=644282 RepID=E1QGU4_DESB2|nr:TldD/PmbA family protein [Desulfarculus baarsii]ADK84787.1 peptidase U62 modulator of DNA gyrase [Desulfarculus baarsii DSM 2075]